MGSGSKTKNSNKTSGRGAKQTAQDKIKDKVAKKKSGRQVQPPSPVQKPIMSPDKDKSLMKKPSNRRATKEPPKEEKLRLSNKRSSSSSMGSAVSAAPPKSMTNKLTDEGSVIRTSKAPSDDQSVSLSLSTPETPTTTTTTTTRSTEKQSRAADDQEKKSKKKLSKDLSVLKLKRIQTARKLDEKVTRCRTKGRPLMAGQVDARQDIERAETNLKEWTKQFNQQMNYLKEMLTKEMGEIRAGMKELEEMEIKTEMESKHVRGAKCCRTMESARV